MANDVKLSPNGKSAFLAYLDSSETDVHVQQVDPSTFASVGTPVTVTGAKEGRNAATARLLPSANE